MSPRDLAHLVLGNLNRMRARVALTATGVLIGTAAIVVLISLAVGLQSSTTAELGSFGDLTTVSVYDFSESGVSVGGAAARREKVPLDERAVDEIADLPHVLAVTPRLSVQGMVELKYGRATVGANIEGIDPSVAPLLGWRLQSGEPRLGGGQVLIGSEVFKRAGYMVFGGGVMVRAPSTTGRAAATAEVPDLQGRTLTAILTKYDADMEEVSKSERLRVAGVFASGGENDYSVIGSIKDVDAYNSWLTGRKRSSRDTFNQVTIKVDDRSNVKGVQSSVRQMGFQTFSALDILESINQVFLIMQAILGSIGGVTLLVAAFGIANTMTMAILERTKEIGVMKAIGATNRDVLVIFLSEAGAIGFLGGALGVVGGWVVGKAIEFFVSTQLQSPAAAAQTAETTSHSLVVTPPWLVGFALVFATMVGLVSGIYPALRAASMKPLRALRME